ncbi:hypothetical protein P691DRAFT_786505 [Macrolepiota fuliginosa MF-IS2]|uniref:Tyr recombinase domain-containing protein n=1 Tax=Macrolepiota fuliginosa MF-IS2 TaxID=1400762 RepID=A0A9P5X5R2_9AGAR|nr:hypothetical protein P691DRAFT_786505 [Macrolepiota fuliginosa MF-IS2]
MSHDGLQEQEQEQVKKLLSLSWDESTLATYRSGLLVYHIYYDTEQISKEARALISSPTLTSFVTSLAGSYSSSTISNYVSGIQAWHILHGLKWSINDNVLEVLLQGTQCAAPPSSKKAKRVPFTLDIISTLHIHLDLDNHAHVAVSTCLTSAFYATACLDVHTVTDHHGLTLTVIHLPHSKASPLSPGITDPEAAYWKHLQYNNLPQDQHIFAYPHKGSFQPLTHWNFMEVMNKAAQKAGLPILHGHGIRIGATLKYLLRGLSFEAMKAKGCWASNAFTVYLTDHTQVLTQHTQAQPKVHDWVIKITIPCLQCHC